MDRNLCKLLAGALCLCLVLTSCGALMAPAGILKDQLTSASPQPTADPTADPTDQGEDWSKYNAYIDLADEMAEMEEILGVYFQNVLYQEEFALADGGDYAAIKDAVQFYTGMSYTVEKALDYADEAPLYLDADAAVLALGDSVSQLMDALDHLGSYMRFDDFVDDHLARAPELHAELWAALETYDVYYPQFISALSDLADQGEEDELDRLLQEDERIRYNTRQMIRAAEDVQDGIWTQLEAAAKADPELTEMPAIDLEPLTDLFGQFQGYYEDLTAALADEGQREKISAFQGRAGEESAKLFTNRANALYVKMGALAQALLDGTDYAQPYDELGEAVTDMIDTYNNYNH